ncbi:MAG: LytTR family transcriptional regulator [Saprospiraceae bacterium]|nr:LytTR family transcriptional regulator [Saprospiraceae bacterium]
MRSLILKHKQLQLHLLQGQYQATFEQNLKEFEESLPDDTFFRCHRSHLINMNYIKKYVKGEGGIIVLSNERK